MMDQHEDPKFEQWLNDAARSSYHSPLPTPREEMWKRIEAARRSKRVIEIRPWMRWALAAAEQGIPAAMTRVGMIYHNAIGVERDPGVAVMWWEKAALRKDADAQAMLGAACLLGAGVAQDGIVALAWLLRAKAGGSALAEPFIASARASLSGEAIAEAERRAAAPLADAPTTEAPARPIPERVS